MARNGILSWLLGQDVIPSQAQAQPHKVKVPQIATPLGDVSVPVIPGAVLPESVILMSGLANPPTDPNSAAGPAGLQPAPLQIFGGVPEAASNNAPGGM